MTPLIDTTFDVYSDTPEGRDPDRHSPTLRRYHQLLWGKLLPGGTPFELTRDRYRIYLHHDSALGQFALSSDSFVHTYRYIKATRPVVSRVPIAELEQFYAICSTIGGYIIFPSNRVDGKPTINGARGLNRKIRDRADLTLECIRRHYDGQESPLREVLARYADFFEIFQDFEGYVDFFLLQDLVAGPGKSVRFFLPFEDFDQGPLPATVDEYRAYMKAVANFVVARNERIEAYARLLS
ncbi:hypothetical protein OZN62_06770 [Aurantiacibacter sp. MUD11]|uniref:DUF6994 family protein n=1 Tax=Aurantiacibacter sp. MUD11 TaxID=3003265 RepID=UPI0022AACC30|nr:hypothetical protein [Aurantiacibacter sp. MUD11]WAT19261.1 hypothetical protein OZN62_06770 [Aurantiacibacter sp. MUD11]